MKFEDEVRDALRDRAEGVSASVDQAWSKLNAPHATPSRGKRVAAALVALAVFTGALLLLARTFAPSTTSQQRASTTYDNATGLAAALHDAGLGCDHLGTFFGILRRGVDVRSCQVNGEEVWLWVYQTPEALQRFHARPSVSPNPSGILHVRGANWLVATKSVTAARAVQNTIGGTLEGLSSATPSTSVASVSVTKAGSLDFSGLGGLVAAQEAYGSFWVGVITDSGGTEVVRADPATGATERTFPIQGWGPNEWGGNGIVVGGGKVWVPGRENGQATIVRIDPLTDRADVLKPAAETIGYLTFGSDGMLWANIGRGDGKAIAQIDPATGEITRTWRYTADWAQEICEAQDTVWVHEMSTSNSTVHGGWLSQVVPGTAPPVETGGTFAGPVCSTDAVWTAIHGDENSVNLANGIAQVDPATGLVVGSWSTPPIGYDIALDGDGGVWFITAGSGNVERLDPSTGDIDATETMTGTPIFISVTVDEIWVGTYEGRLFRFDLAH